ncbi:MAG: ArsR/SmtB family transcription factor [Puniceicoccaceae bacterium]
MKEKLNKLEELAGSGGLEQATEVLGLMSHGERLRVLCLLSQEGELSVGQLLERIDLSASALSQHLARLRRGGLVATRKERQTVYYRVGRGDVGQLLETLYGLYCDGVNK